ncbi:hypothetical protein Pen01_28990 [Phytomonospora endophytica]|nr:hypothetical protein Pen01_28990 [Phytomonospora endophytica]
MGRGREGRAFRQAGALPAGIGEEPPGEPRHHRLGEQQREEAEAVRDPRRFERQRGHGRGERTDGDEHGRPGQAGQPSRDEGEQDGRDRPPRAPHAQGREDQGEPDGDGAEAGEVDGSVHRGDDTSRLRAGGTCRWRGIRSAGDGEGGLGACRARRR